ncbi:MAG TPA: peptidoglycan-binding protein [Caulobacteraceae bacterium]|nr:peptidoglycan-binding protein [Caulobacteraceae bacterium]
MHRRVFLALAAVACLPDLWALGAAAEAAAPQPSDLLGAAGDPPFLAWLNGFYARELAAGWSTTLLAETLTGLAPDPRVLEHNASQPEFSRPISDYIARNVTPGVVAMGRARRDAVSQFPKIVEAYGVPADVLTAIWAMESGFGSHQGDMDVVRSLATLAAEDPRRKDWAEKELEACIKIVGSGAARRDQLKGSWAGAMGQTQMEPSTFLSTAVAATGSGAPDIWSSSADALASAANLLVKGGWRRSESWAREVLLAKRFDVGLSEGPKQPPAWWEEKGVARADGRAWDDADQAAEAQLILPAGALGPAFLLFPNHFVIRTYNNSLAYALSVGLLADALAGRPPLATPWPKEVPLSLEDRMAAQSALAKLGYNPGAPDGFIGLATRQALRAWQRDRHIPADGYLAPDLVARLKADAAGGPT